MLFGKGAIQLRGQIQYHLPQRIGIPWQAVGIDRH
jgi:hypothetical protein